MNYLLMLYVRENDWKSMTPAQQQPGMAAYTAYTEALAKAGALKSSGRLQPSSSATRVQLANRAPQVLDGPYLDTKEQLGGYYLDRGGRSRRRDHLGRALPGRQPRRGGGPPAMAANRVKPVGAREGDAAAQHAAQAGARRSYGKLVALLAAQCSVPPGHV